MDKCRQFPILDSLYNWLARYLEDRQHITKFGGMLSDFRRITASIVQGSGIGPTAFVLTASDLRALSLFIFLNKYADDCYLIVPPDQASSILSELTHVEKWAQDNNLKLNVLKTKEMIVRRPRSKLGNIPPPTPGIERVKSMKILGVVYEEDFSFREHVERMVIQSNQSLYAIRTLRAQGLCGTHLWDVARATIVARMRYASPAWGGLRDEGSRQRLQAILNKLRKQGFLPGDHATMMELCDDADSRLFASILHNPYHVLHRLLPPVRDSSYICDKGPTLEPFHSLKITLSKKLSLIAWYWRTLINLTLLITFIFDIDLFYLINFFSFFVCSLLCDMSLAVQ